MDADSSERRSTWGGRGASIGHEEERAGLVGARDCEPAGLICRILNTQRGRCSKARVSAVIRGESKRGDRIDPHDEQRVQPRKRAGSGKKMHDRDNEKSAGGAGSRPRVVTTTRQGALALLAAFCLLAPGSAQAAAELVLVPDIPTLVGLVLFFIGLVVVSNALIFKPIFQALDDRTERVEGARQRAEELDHESDALLQRYDSSLREVRAEAESKRKNALGHAREQQLGLAEEARARAEERVEEARTQLQVALLSAREGLRESSREIARAVAARVIGREL